MLISPILTNDYRDELSDFWTAHIDGNLYIGPTTKLPFVRFLDSIIGRVAALLNTEPLLIWNDVQESGSFVKFENDILTFRYQNVELNTNTLTGVTESLIH